MPLRLNARRIITTAIATMLVSTVLAVAEPKYTPDIEYARPAGVPLKLDAYVPAAPGPHPVVLYVHGGGWGSGDKKADTQPLEALKAADLVVFSIDYRLAPTHRWPACFDDVNAAIRWAKANAARYHGDPARIALVGYSAGGQLALLAATTGDATTCVQAVVGLAPPTDFELDLKDRNGLSKSLQDLLNRPQPVDAAALARLRDIGPVHHVRPGQPPILIFHGTADKSVPFAGSLAFQNAVQTAGGQCDLIPLPDAPHRIRDWRHADAAFGRKMTDWLSARLAMPPEATTQPK